MLINRRLMIIYYWLFKNRYSVSLIALFRRILLPKIDYRAKKLINSIQKETILSANYLVVSLKTLAYKLYWPESYDIKGLYQVIIETFESNDWHFYETFNTKVEKNDTVVDVGAAEGLFSLSVLDRCKNIVIIEPNKLFVESLKCTFKNYLGKNVELFNLAAGNTNTQVEINDNGISSGIIQSKNGGIKMSTLDDILTNNHVDYIKADIEGYEMDMLRGAAETIRKNRPKMAITCYHGNNDYNEMINYVKMLVPEYKYDLTGITQYGGKPVMIHFYIHKD